MLTAMVTDTVTFPHADCPHAASLLDRAPEHDRADYAARLLVLVEQHGAAAVDRAIAALLETEPPPRSPDPNAVAAKLEAELADSLDRFEKQAHRIKQAMRYYGTYGTSDIVSALVERWIKSGKLRELQGLPPEKRNIAQSVRNFILDRIDIDRVEVAINRRNRGRILIEVLDEATLADRARRHRTPKLVRDTGDVLDLTGKVILLHRLEPAARSAALEHVATLGGTLAPPRGKCKIDDYLAGIHVAVIGPKSGDRVQLPDDHVLAQIVENETMKEWIRTQASELAIGKPDSRIKLPPEDCAFVGAVLLKSIRGLTQREIAEALSVERGAAVNLTRVHHALHEGEDYLVALHALEDVS